MSKVCHLTSVHPPFDIRIFHKQCLSLSGVGYEVSLIAPINSIQEKQGVQIIPIQLPKSRLKRVLVVTFRMLKIALKQKAKLYHFHDPELIACGALLKLFGKKVIFDIHENIRLGFKSKSWIPKLFVPFLVFFYYIIERSAILFFDALVLAEESYLKYYPENKSTLVLNYPIINKTDVKERINDHTHLVYVGGVMATRGIWHMLNLVKELKIQNFPIKLTIIGTVYYDVDRQIISIFLKDEQLEDDVKVVGQIPFEKVKEYLLKADIGLALLKPIPNYKESLPTKIFEYMQLGLPVITSNFPLYKKYVEQEDTGICIDYNNFEDEIDKIKALIGDKERQKEMGANGMKAVEQKYNWNSEFDKLDKLYNRLLN